MRVQVHIQSFHLARCLSEQLPWRHRVMHDALKPLNDILTHRPSRIGVQLLRLGKVKECLVIYYVPAIFQANWVEFSAWEPRDPLSKDPSPSQPHSVRFRRKQSHASRAT